MFSQISTSRPLRALTAAVVAGGIALGVSACSQPTTDLFYAPSDGTRVQLESGSMEVVNLMFLRSADKDEAHLVGAVVNKGSEDNVASLVSEDGTLNTQIPVLAYGTTNLFTDLDQPALVENFTAPAGSNVTVTFSDQQGTSAQIHIPVLDGSLPEYAQYVP